MDAEAADSGSWGSLSAFLPLLPSSTRPYWYTKTVYSSRGGLCDILNFRQPAEDKLELCLRPLWVES